MAWWILMADPKLVKVIGVKVAAASIGEYVTIKNLSRGGELSAKLGGTDRSAVINPAPSLEWQEGDFVQAEIHGRIDGYKRDKLASGGTNLIIAASADTTAPGADL